MKYSVQLFVIISLFACQTKKQETSKEVSNTYPTIGVIERINPVINQIIPVEAKIEVIGTGMVWAEGPLWVPEKGWVLCSDVKENRIHKWTEEGGFVTFLEPSGFTGDTTDSREKGSNGLTLDPDGNLVMCQHGNRRVAKLTANLSDPRAEFESLAAQFEGKRLNSPNDLIYDSKGNLYFTDPPFGLSEAMMDDPKKELSFQGVYKLSTSGELTLLTDEMSRPNGLALSPDESRLYLSNADTQQAIWMEYPMLANRTLGEGKLFHDATEFVGKEVGVPDGVKVHSNGFIFTAGPGGLWVFDPTGEVIAKIKPGEWVSNCAFDETESALYITADDYLLRVRLK